MMEEMVFCSYEGLQIQRQLGRSRLNQAMRGESGGGGHERKIPESGEDGKRGAVAKKPRVRQETKTPHVQNGWVVWGSGWGKGREVQPLGGRDLGKEGSRSAERRHRHWVGLVPSFFET